MLPDLYVMVSRAGDHGGKLSKYTSHIMLSILEYTVAPKRPGTFFQPAASLWLAALLIITDSIIAGLLPWSWARNSATDMVLAHAGQEAYANQRIKPVMDPSPRLPLARLASWLPMGPRGSSPIPLGKSRIAPADSARDPNHNIGQPHK